MRIACFMLFFAGLLASSSVFGQGWYDDEEDTTKIGAEDSLDIAEKCFIDLFYTNKGKRKHKHYIISFLHYAPFKYIDPSPSFMARFSNITPSVKNLTYYYDNEKKLKGKVLLCYVRDMERVSKNRVIVHCGYWESRRTSAGHKIELVYKNGAWEIDRSVVEWEL